MKLFPSRIAASHEDLFVERYEQLLSWALQLSDQNRELAEDLLHDAFIQFSFARPELHTIRNLDSYFYGMLRNLHLSQVRRTTRSRMQQLSTVEYDSAEASLRATDARGQIAVQDELRRVCHYACVRKEKTRAAGVLILRFFHGYYPSEIAQILRNTRQAVDVHLLLARNEARAFLQNPETLAFMGEESVVEVFPTDFARTTDSFLNELRQMIFGSRRGDCLSIKQLRGLYRKSQPEPMNSKGLAHIVSCPKCLDEVNKLLGLPLISERYPADTIDKETPKRGGPRGGGAGGMMSGSMNRYQQRARNAFEHKPQELCVSVNGYIQGSQRISSEQSELNLTIDTAEKIGFVEVFSEQDVRLLLMSVDDLPPDGPAEQSLRVGLSDGRELEVTLRFRSPWPTLHVAYHDPTFKEVESLLAELPTQEIEPGDVESGPRGQGDAEMTMPSRQPFAHTLARLWPRLSDLNVWLRPGTVTGLLAVVLIATVVFIELRHVPTSPANVTTLLSQSAATEDLIAANVDQALHRTINLEERKSSGELIARRKIEVWQSAQRGITARRLFDEHGQLIAGDWRRSDGVQTLYHHGAQPKLQLAPETREGSALSFDSVWQLSPSAKEFAQLIGDTAAARVEERSIGYVVSYSQEPSRTAGALLEAELVLTHDDLRPIQQRIKLQEGDEVREYNFVESSFEQYPSSSVDPKVFEPDPALMVGDLGRTKTEVAKAADSKERNTTEPNGSVVVASEDLEVEVSYLLDRVKANLGDQVSLTRTAEGRLRVEGIIDSEQRKAEILHALSPVANNPAVRIELQTVAEALKRQRQKTADAAVAGNLTATEGFSLPVDSQLRRYLASRGVSDDRMDEQVREFSNRMIARSRQAMRHAFALKHLADQFNEEQLRLLSPEARVKRLSMFREHAQAFERETQLLRAELEPILPSSSEKSVEIKASLVIRSEADLAAAVRKLFELGSSYDKAIGSTFAISSETSGGSAINKPQFWQLLRSAEKIAQLIQNAPQTLNSSN